MKRVIPFLMVAGLSLNAHASSYAGIDYSMINVGKAQSQMVTLTLGNTFTDTLSSEVRLGFGVAGDTLDKLASYEDIVGSANVNNASGNVVSDTFMVESQIGAYLRYTYRLTTKQGLSAVGGISRFKVSMSEDMVTSYNDINIGPSFGGGYYYTLENGATLTLEAMKHRNFYNAEMFTFNIGFKSAF